MPEYKDGKERIEWDQSIKPLCKALAFSKSLFGDETKVSSNKSSDLQAGEDLFQSVINGHKTRNWFLDLEMTPDI